MEQTSGRQEFWSDLKLALSAWGKAPALPLVSVLFTALIYLPSPWNLFFLPVMIISLGWPGTERIWYLRIFRGLPVTAGELWRLTRAFILRYLFLGLAVFLPLLVIAFIAGSVTAGEFGPRPDPAPPGFLIPISLGLVLLQIALTFVTQALAYSTTQIGTALRMGISTLRAEWPRSAWYAVIPAISSQLAWAFEQNVNSFELRPVAQGVIWTLLILWFKGATAAFYLRRHEVGDSGAAFEESPEVTAADSPGETPPDAT